MLSLDTKNKILLLMSIAVTFSYLPWFNFSAVLSSIAAEFNLTGSDTGAILAAFQVGYIIIVIFSGRMADLFGTKKIIFWATLITGISSTAFAFVVKDFYTILIMRLITGLSAGAIYAPGMDLLSNWFKSEQRGYAIGTYTGAMTLAYGGGYFAAAPLAAVYGWRAGILWTSLPVFLAVFIIWFFVQEKPEEEDGTVLTPGVNPGCGKNTYKETAVEVQAEPAPKGGYSGPAFITVSYMGHMWELYAFWGWIGPFMVASALASGYSNVEAAVLGGRFAALIILLGVPAVWFLGIVADKWGRTRTIIIGSLCSLAAQFVFGFLYGRSLALVVIVGLWIGFWVVSDSGIFKAGLTEMVSPEIRSTSLGIQSAVGYSMTIISPWLFGSVLDYLNHGVNPALAENWGVPFILLGAGALLAPIAAFILRKLPQANLMAGGKK